jgi:hypothetical protein
MAKRNIILTGLISIIIFYIPVLFLTRGTLLLLTKEDGVYESLGALFFFLASIGFLYIFFIAKKRNIFFLFFALAFFFAAGEEISWGQRIFNFDTPSFIEANNDQEEFNIHNLDIVQHENGIGSSIKGFLFNFNHLFILASIAYCILIPLAYTYSSKSKNLFIKMRLPIISLWFGILFILNEITSKSLEVFIVACQSNCPKVYEIKEALWALFVFLWAIYFFFEYVRKKDAISPAL